MNAVTPHKKTTRRRVPLGLPHRRRVALYSICVGVWLSGIAWLILHYFMQVETEFGVSSNPLEHWSLAVHGGFSFASLWAFGLLWGVHIKSGWSRRWRRRSGGTLVGVILWLVVSGLAIYYIGDEEILSWVAISHWAVGLGALGIFLLHWLSKSEPRGIA